MRRRFGHAKERLGYYALRRRLRQPRFRRAVRAQDAFLIGHPKSGNTWVAFVLAHLIRAGDAGEPTLRNVGDFVPFVHGREDLIGQYAHLPDPRVFRNEYPQHRALYPRAIYLVRDPRAVLVSFWHMYGVVSGDRNTDLASFVDQYMTRTGCFQDWHRRLERWDHQVTRSLADVDAGRPICLVRYEDLVEDANAAFARIARFLGVAAEGPRFEEAVAQGSFESMRRLEERFGAEAFADVPKDFGRFVREGKAEGWKTEMDPGLAKSISTEFSDPMTRLEYRP